MKANLRPYIIGAVCLATLSPTAYGFFSESKVSGASSAANALRTSQLETVAKDGIVNACYTLPEIANGQLLTLKEKPASSCVRSTGIDGRVGYIAYKDGELRIQNVFTQTEVQNMTSVIRQQAKEK